MTPYESAMIRLYDEPHRRYHGISHICDLMDLFFTGRVRGLELRTRPCLRFGALERQLIIDAIWAHDCVYLIGEAKGYNEKQSFVTWQQIVNHYGDHHKHGEEYQEAVRTMVHATIDHDMPKDIDPALRKPLEWFLDMDMAALAVDPFQWNRNTEALFQEFRTQFTAEQITEGRKSFLKATLAKPLIYHSDFMYMALEDRARENIERELKRLA